MCCSSVAREAIHNLLSSRPILASRLRLPFCSRSNSVNRRTARAVHVEGDLQTNISEVIRPSVLASMKAFAEHLSGAMAG